MRRSIYFLVLTFFISTPLWADQPPAPWAALPQEVALINAVARAGGQSVRGGLDPRICAQTRYYAAQMARQGYQDGHANFNYRAQAVGGGASEITAESWGWESSLEQHAAECVNSWRQSPGHARAMFGYHQAYCYSMERSRNGRFYCVGLFRN